MALLVPFGLKDGLLYEPRQVANGKACGCICPGCQHPLVAKQNAQTPHFAHAPGEDCKNGLETAIHLAAKQLIAERMEVSIPAVILQFPGGYGERPSTQDLYTSHLKPLSEVRIEPWLDGFRPDIVVVESHRQRKILIEIAVTHFVDDAKLTKIKDRGIHAIEIDVSSAREQIDFALLNRFLFGVPSLGRWLYHPEAAELEQQYITKRADAWEARRKAESDQFAKYRTLNPRVKLRKNLAKAGLNEAKLKALSVFVSGEDSFDDGRYAWQSAVLAYIVHQVEENGLEGKPVGVWLDKDDLDDWLIKIFDITPKFPDAEKIAVWKYLKHLESLGLLSGIRNKSFEILILPKDYQPQKT